MVVLWSGGQAVAAVHIEVEQREYSRVALLQLDMLLLPQGSPRGEHDFLYVGFDFREGLTHTCESLGYFREAVLGSRFHLTTVAEVPEDSVDIQEDSKRTLRVRDSFRRFSGYASLH